MPHRNLTISDDPSLRLARPCAPEADAVLGLPILMLDDLAFVRLVDYMGNDDAIVRAARISYGAESRPISEDRDLIRYLLRHKHTSPFEHVDLTFHIRAPLFVARQQLRTRTASVNEVSARYKELSGDHYLPGLARMQAQARDNKQGSGAPLDPEAAERALELIASAYDACDATYRELIALGLAKEISRTVEPVGAYTEYYFKIDLHNLFHFLKNRLDKHAQWEIRVVAAGMELLAARVAPLAHAAFVEYVRDAADLSATELSIVRALARQMPGQAELLATSAGLAKRELREFLEKLTEGAA